MIAWRRTLKVSFRLAAVCAALLIAVPATQAEDGLYAGLGLGAGWGQSDGPGGSAGTLGNFGLTLGYRQDMDSFFWGGEIDTDLSFYDQLTSSGDTCSVGAHGPYYCTHDATVRFRGLIGTEIVDGLELFGTFGVGVMTGLGATNTNTTDQATTAGLTAGFGAQMDLGDGTLRGEFIYDGFNHNLDPAQNASSPYTPTWSAASVKLTYLFGF
jgi:hypothetical protein